VIPNTLLIPFRTSALKQNHPILTLYKLAQCCHELVSTCTDVNLLLPTHYLIFWPLKAMQRMIAIRYGRIFFSSSLIALSIQHLFLDHYLVNSPGPESITGVIFVFFGFLYKVLLATLAAALLFHRKPAIAGVGLGMTIIAWIGFRHFPLFIGDITDPSELNFMAIGMAIAASAFFVAESFRYSILGSHGYSARHWLTIITPLGRYLYAVSMVIFGFQHLVYADFIASLIPLWIPAHKFWAYATGALLIAAGLSIILAWRIRSGSLWLGRMIGLWVLLIHLPKVLANPGDMYEWTNLFQSVAITSGAFVLHQNYCVENIDKLKPVGKPLVPSRPSILKEKQGVSMRKAPPVNAET
jgi:hypothetical protein